MQSADAWEGAKKMNMDAANITAAKEMIGFFMINFLSLKLRIYVCAVWVVYLKPNIMGFMDFF
jgi:hypothetical protein